MLRIYNWIMMGLIQLSADWLFPKLYPDRYKCEFERKHGWIPKPESHKKENDSGIHPEW